jgi:hypothetical protein
VKFSAFAFHQICDNIAHTLVLVRTEFGKTIGGYTPLIWNAMPDGRYDLDEHKKSFLFSLDSLERMSLVDPVKAIRCDSKEQDAITAFCRARNGYQFRVLDYEVYHVVWP